MFINLKRHKLVKSHFRISNPGKVAKVSERGSDLLFVYKVKNENAGNDAFNQNSRSLDFIERKIGEILSKSQNLSNLCKQFQDLIVTSMKLIFNTNILFMCNIVCQKENRAIHYIFTDSVYA